MARDPVRRREGDGGGRAHAAEGASAAGKRTRVEAAYPTLARALRGESAPASGEAPTIHDAATAAVEHKGGGAPVDGGVAATVGAHLGADFGGVRVHQDAMATEASAAMGARAFAHGADVFLGAGESGGDLGLMAHELTHVAQQGAAGRRAVQRKVEVGDANSPAEHEADAVAAAVTGGAAPAALLVDDGPVAPGQMLKSTFLAELRAAVTAAADAELGPTFSAIGCPYIDQYFRRYTTRSAADGEALLRRYAPGVRSARDAHAMIPIVVERVRAGVAVWRDTGQPPPEVAALEPAAAAAATTATAAAGAPAGPPGSAAATVARMGPAEALPGSVASQMSSVLGHDVSGVHIHTAPQAAAFASDHGASAVTVGSHVAFAAGQFSPGTAAGDALLAHELAHTVQQAGATATDLQQPLGAERAPDEDEADDVAATVAVAHATGAAPKRSLGGFLRGGLSLQRCNVATKAPTDFAAMSVKDKAAWIEGTLRSGKDGRGYTIVEAFRQASPADFVALQSQTDFAAVVTSLSDWDAVNVGAMGPVVGPAAQLLNAKRAAYVAHAIAEYGGAQAEVHAAYVVSSMYDDDLDDLAMELANRNKLGRLMAMPTVRTQFERRGVAVDRYQDTGDSRSGVRKFFGGMKDRLWDFATRNRDDDHYAHALPGEFGAASQAIDIEGTLPVSAGGVAHLLDNTLTFGMVGGVVGLGTNTVHGIGNLIDGDYEAAGADLTDAALAVTVHLGIKAISGRPAQPAAPGTPAASGVSAEGLVGPAGPAQFTVPGFAGPLTAAEAKLGATVARGLAVEAQAAIGRIMTRIGRGGVERVAGYLRNREAAALVAEHGEAAVYALDEAQGNVAAARTRLPARQLGSGPATPPPATVHPSGLSPAVLEVLAETGVDADLAGRIAARGISGDAIAEIAIDHGAPGVQVLDGLTRVGLDAKATSKVLKLGAETGTMTDLVDLTKDGLLENPRGLGKFLERMAAELRIDETGLRNELRRVAAKSRNGHRVSLGGRRRVPSDPESGQADVVDYSTREAEQVKTVSSPRPEAVRDHIQKALAQLDGHHGEHPPLGYQRTVVVKIESPKNPLYGLTRDGVRQAIAEWCTQILPDVTVVIENGNPHAPFTFSSEELQQ